MEELAAKYVKMVRVGMPEAVVMQRAAAAGVDPDLVTAALVAAGLADDPRADGPAAGGVLDRAAATPEFVSLCDRSASLPYDFPTKANRLAVVCGAAPFFIKQLRRLVRKILRRVRGEAEPPEGAAPAAASMKVVDVEAAAQDPSGRSRGWSAGSGGDSGTEGLAPAPNSPALEATAGSSSAEGSPRLGPSALPRDGSRKLFTQALEDSYRSSVAAKRSEGSSPERMV